MVEDGASWPGTDEDTEGRSRTTPRTYKDKCEDNRGHSRTRKPEDTVSGGQARTLKDGQGRSRTG
jgi:hypothetical protein